MIGLSFFDAGSRLPMRVDQGNVKECETMPKTCCDHCNPNFTVGAFVSHTPMKSRLQRHDITGRVPPAMYHTRVRACVSESESDWGGKMFFSCVRQQRGSILWHTGFADSFMYSLTHSISFIHSLRQSDSRYQSVSQAVIPSFLYSFIHSFISTTFMALGLKDLQCHV